MTLFITANPKIELFPESQINTQLKEMVSAWKVATNATAAEEFIKLWTDPHKISYLNDQTTGETGVPKYTAEWTLGDDYNTALPGKEGLMIGKGGAHLKGLQKGANDKYGPLSVLAVWATKTPSGKTVFGVLGNNKDAILETLTRIKNQAAIFMTSHGWTVFPTPMRMVFYSHYEDPDHLYHWIQATPDPLSGWATGQFYMVK